MRPIGTLATNRRLSSAVAASVKPVSKTAGTTQLTRTPVCGNSFATDLVKAITPALAAE
jgi:hypothetical protein